MHKRLGVIDFDCPHCGEALQEEMQALSNPVPCPACTAVIKGEDIIPMVQPVRKNRPVNRNRRDDSVSVRMGIPGVGGYEGQMSKKDAAKVGFGILGALAALMGVIVAGMLGVRLPKGS